MSPSRATRCSITQANSGSEYDIDVAPARYGIRGLFIGGFLTKYQMPEMVATNNKSERPVVQKFLPQTRQLQR